MTSVELKSPTAPDSVTVTESNELESNDEEGLCGVIADCGTVNVDVDCACTLTIAKAVAVASSDNFNIVKLVIVECQRSCRVQYNSSKKAAQSQGSQAMKQVVLSLVCNGRSAQWLVRHLRSLEYSFGVGESTFFNWKPVRLFCVLRDA